MVDPETKHRRLAAIVSADVAGYSVLLSRDEAGTVEALRAHLDHIFRPLIERHQGRVVDTAGDGFLAEFQSAVQAVTCCVEAQRRMRAENDRVPPDRRLEFRIGINLGDVLVETGGAIYGEGINVAARLEAIADAGGICMSQDAFGQVRGKLDIAWRDGGTRELKNISHPVHVWHWHPDGVARTTTEPETKPGLPDKPSVVVLPFLNASNDEEQGFFCDDVSEDLTSALSRFGALFVIAWGTALSFKDQKLAPSAVSEKLGVQYVVHGSIRRRAQRLRIGVQLIDATNDRQIWAEKYERVVEDLFLLQDEIIRRIIGEISPQITRAEIERTRLRHPDNLTAYEFALRAHESALVSYRTTKDPTLGRQAIDLANRSLAMDPDCALAKLAIIETHLGDFIHARSDAEVLSSALSLAQSVQEHDPNDHRSYLCLGRIAFMRRRHDEAVLNVRRALEINPNDPRALFFAAWVMGASGYPEDSAKHADLALRISPHDFETRWSSYWCLSQSAFLMRDYARGVEFGRLACAELPNHGGLYGMLAACLAEAGDLAQASEALEKSLTLAPEYYRDRLAGNTYYKRPEDHERYLEALRKAKAGP